MEFLDEEGQQDPLDHQVPQDLQQGEKENLEGWFTPDGERAAVPRVPHYSTQGRSEGVLLAEEEQQISYACPPILSTPFRVDGENKATITSMVLNTRGQSLDAPIVMFPVLFAR